MCSFEVSGLLVRPIAHRVQEWVLAGKLDEDDLERSLSGDARALVDHSVAATDWVPGPDIEGLVSLVAAQLGGETGLVEWADEIVRDWMLDDPIDGLVTVARRLADGPGFVVSQASERLLRAGDWRYEGGRDGFAVRLLGLDGASPALKALIGATLARLAAATESRALDVRFDGVDGTELVVFGEVERTDDALSESRLHRAALIPPVVAR